MASVGRTTPYDEGVLCVECAEAEYVRFWIERRAKGCWKVFCPSDCPFGRAGWWRGSLGLARPR
jgi:hypothetical protein